MEITNEEFKHFRTFLLKNSLYKDFMECFREQKYSTSSWGLDVSAQPLPNYMIAMREYAKSKNNQYNDFGAMIFTFASFNWVNGGHVPLPFTKKWCTTNLKWGVYCKLNNIEICDDTELKRLIGLSPDITTHTVENAIYQLRKKYGRDIILNINGKYKIG